MALAKSATDCFSIQKFSYNEAKHGHEIHHTVMWSDWQDERHTCITHSRVVTQLAPGSSCPPDHRIPSASDDSSQLLWQYKKRTKFDNPEHTFLISLNLHRPTIFTIFLGTTLLQKYIFPFVQHTLMNQCQWLSNRMRLHTVYYISVNCSTCFGW